MRDSDDLMLSALFQDAQVNEDVPSHDAFTQAIMARVIDDQARHKAFKDALMLAVVASVALVTIVLLPTALPQIQTSLEASWLKNASNFSFSDQSLLVFATLLLSGLGWAVAVKD